MASEPGKLVVKAFRDAGDTRFADRMEAGERERLLEKALADLKEVVAADLLPICQEHGGDVWAADAFRVQSVFAQVDKALLSQERPSEGEGRCPNCLYLDLEAEKPYRLCDVHCGLSDGINYDD